MEKLREDLFNLTKVKERVKEYLFDQITIPWLDYTSKIRNASSPICYLFL